LSGGWPKLDSGCVRRIQTLLTETVFAVLGVISTCLSMAANPTTRSGVFCLLEFTMLAAMAIDVL
jgi:hypothetical protein